MLPHSAARELQPICGRGAEAHDARWSGVLGKVLDYVGPGPNIITLSVKTESQIHIEKATLITKSPL